VRSNLKSDFQNTLSRTALNLTAVTLLAATLAACGGGDSIQFPEPQAASLDAAHQRKATAAQAIEVTQSLRQAVTQAVAAGQTLTSVQTTVNAQAVALPGGGSITEVRLEYGGTIVADVNLPELPAAPATGAAPTSGPLVTPSAGVIESALSPATAGRGQLIWVAYPVSEGVVRWYCFGSYSSVAQDTDNACLYPGDSARGMTWGTLVDKSSEPFTQDPTKINRYGLDPEWALKFNISNVSCFAKTPPTLGKGTARDICDYQNGDWHVLRKLPLLCVKQSRLPPPTDFYSHSNGVPFFNADAAVTPPVYGVQLLGFIPGDALCKDQFGDGWKMADEHALGSEVPQNFAVRGQTPTDTRFWVAKSYGLIQPNPWCVTLTGLSCDGRP
jgi:hypothetical protein